MKNALMALLAMLISSTALAAGPFGVTMGSPISAYPSCSAIPNTPAIYKCPTLPNPHDSFEGYYIQAYPQTGACMVKGVGSNITDGGDGAETRSVIARMADQLISKYGKPTKTFDFQTGGEALDAHQFWVMTLKDKQRHYAMFWQFPAGNEANVVAIELSASALTYSTTYMTLEYDFKNSDACDQIAKAKGASSL